MRTVLSKVLDRRDAACGKVIGRRMLRECALIHDEVHYYTDGLHRVVETAIMPPGRVTVHVHGNPDQGVMDSISGIIIENAVVRKIGPAN